jgi:hypothetical protein
LHSVDTTARCFDNHIRRRVDNICIVAETSYERVGSSPAVQRVVAFSAKKRVVTSEAEKTVGGRISDQDVAESIARSVDRRGSKQGQISNSAPRVSVTVLSTVSVPPPGTSTITSATVSTT